MVTQPALVRLKADRWRPAMNVVLAAGSSSAQLVGVGINPPSSSAIPRRDPEAVELPTGRSSSVVSLGSPAERIPAGPVFARAGLGFLGHLRQLVTKANSVDVPTLPVRITRADVCKTVTPADLDRLPRDRLASLRHDLFSPGR